MFLNQLEKEEKVKFLELAHYVANADKTVTEQESLIIFRYCSEMKIADIDFDEKKYNLKNSLKDIQDPCIQKIFLLEILALVYSDEQFQDEEKDVIGMLVNCFRLNPNLVIVYSQWAKSILALQIQGEALINL